jgi:hypothetical protein
LASHFIDLIPYADELFGNDMPYDPTLGPTYYIFPNILTFINYVDILTPSIYLTFLSTVAIFFMLGIYHQQSAIILWYGWASLLNRNVLMYNPGIPYVGFLLLLCTLIKYDNKIPVNIYWFAWFLMAIGYTVSGIHKLQCPSWINGTALIHILEGPLARDNVFRDILISLPTIVLKISTWFSLVLQLYYHIIYEYYFFHLDFFIIQECGFGVHSCYFIWESCY